MRDCVRTGLRTRVPKREEIPHLADLRAKTANQLCEPAANLATPLGSPGGAPGLRVIRAVTFRYVRSWLAGWLLFRWLAPGFAARALVLGNRPTCAGRFRVAGNRCGLAGGASS